ncbi:MAG: DUF6491 family protein [Woeseiaceae bacterium]|nr:DUF6491 family protein [Woeseiaceae bacterium]
MRKSNFFFAVCLTPLALQACSTPQPRAETEAVRDYIAAAELEETDQIRYRTMSNFEHRPINEEFAVLATHDEHYLLEFRRRCFALYDTTFITPDVRRDSNTLRAGFDTIRGCVMEKIYPIDEAQALELGQLGDAPGDEDVVVHP